jgi:hypothetical protein
LENGTSLVFSLGIRILILISIGEKIILDSHWFMKDEGAIDWREGFLTSIGQGEQSQGGVLEAYRGREGYLVFCGWKRGEGKYGKEISSYVRKGVVHEKKKYVQTKAWKEVVCHKYLKWSS